MGDTRKSASVVVNVTLILNAWEVYKIVCMKTPICLPKKKKPI